jgi:hypothetical protein
MTNEKFPNIGTYVTAEMHRKFRFLAVKNGTSMSKLMYALIVTATKDITIADIDKFEGKHNESKASTGIR